MTTRRRFRVVLGIYLLLATEVAFAQGTARPARSGAIAATPDGSRVWVVNPDSRPVPVGKK